MACSSLCKIENPNRYANIQTAPVLDCTANILIDRITIGLDSLDSYERKSDVHCIEIGKKLKFMHKKESIDRILWG